jgi:hypothetical protein
MILLAHGLDPDRVVELCGSMVTTGRMPGSLWEACSHVLASTSGGPGVVARFVPPDYVGAAGLPGPWVERWMRSFAMSPTISDEVLIDRFRACAAEGYRGGKWRGTEGGPYAVRPSDTAAVIVGGALLLGREAWAYVPEIAAARFDHPHAPMRRALGSLFEMVSWTVPVPRRPLIDYLADEQLFHTELVRDPTRAFVELEPHAIAAHEGLRQQLRKIDGSVARRLIRAEARWKDLLRGRNQTTPPGRRR